MNDHGALCADRLLDLRVALEIDPQVANGRILVHRHDAPLVLARRGEHERTVGEPERLAHPPDQSLENLVRAQRSGHFLEDVEQQVAGAQRVARLSQVAADPEMGVDAGAELAEVDGARDRVLGAGEDRLGGRLRPPLADEDEHRGAAVARPGRELPDQVGQPGLPAGDRVEQQVGRRPVGALRGAALLLGDLEPATH